MLDNPDKKKPAYTINNYTDNVTFPLHHSQFLISEGTVSEKY